MRSEQSGPVRWETSAVSISRFFSWPGSDFPEKFLPVCQCSDCGMGKGGGGLLA